MKTIEDCFILHTANGGSFERHRKGSVAYITNGFKNNGVCGFVSPLDKETTYSFKGIVLSAFCEATVQIPPFIARGNGGSGLMVLEPRKPATADQLGYIAAFINTSLRWRFNWYRQATVERVRRLQIPPLNAVQGKTVKLPVRSLLPPPPPKAERQKIGRLQFKDFPLESIFEMQSGDFHNGGELPSGDVPLVSCGDANNGIVRFVDVPEDKIYSHKTTVSFNGMNTLTTKFHPYPFAAKDDVAVCSPLLPLQPETLLFIQVMMARERWRYSYYRKCFMEKLRRQSVHLPATKNAINESAIAAIVRNSRYWQFLQPRYAGN